MLWGSGGHFQAMAPHSENCGQKMSEPYKSCGVDVLKLSGSDYLGTCGTAFDFYGSEII